MNGKTSSRRNLRSCDGGRRDRRGRPVLQEPVLGAADSERRNCPGVRGVLSEVPEASVNGPCEKRSKSDYAPRILRGFNEKANLNVSKNFSLPHSPGVRAGGFIFL